MKYKALSVVTVQAGALVKLTSKQAARTAGLTKPVAEHKGWTEVVHPFQFKAGEEFETDTEFGKGSTSVKVLDDKNPVGKPSRADRAAAAIKAANEADAAAAKADADKLGAGGKT
jgi:hypothetical protein